MAIYKPSNIYPNLKEIDLTEDNIFSCQINTSGETVKAYKTAFLSGDNNLIYSPNAQELTTPVKNKDTLKMDIPANISANLVNNKNNYYKWNVRLYNAVLSSTLQPNTKVCTGFIAGSTKSVVWTSCVEDIDKKVVADTSWLEFSTVGNANIMPVLPPNADNIKLPADGESYIERKKITWVTNELGFNKQYTKLEFDEDFKYNYVDGTTFVVYPCSSDHGYNNFFTDPNDMINLSYFVVIYSSQADKQTVEAQGDLVATSFPYTTGVTMVQSPRKITGYSSDTGEVRVQQKFSSVPTNGQYYVVYYFDVSTNKYILQRSTTSQKIGGTALFTGVLLNNYWSESEKRLFIQPNINIKSDATNPNELVFQNGDRFDIVQNLSTTFIVGKTTDMTIDRLDDSQWLLTSLSSSNGVSVPPLIPKTPYTVFTDFIDSMPDAVFYGKTSPTIEISYKNMNSDDEYVVLSDDDDLELRDIEFKANWLSTEEVQIKYFKYYLVDKNDNIIGSSGEIYSNELYWNFRGLECDNANNISGVYSVQIVIVDEFNKIFKKTVTFSTMYEVTNGIIDTVLDEKTNSIQITVLPPKTIIPVASDDKEVVTNEDINREKSYLEIKDNEILNYGEMITTPYSDIIIPKTFSMLTQLQITSEFLNSIPVGGELPLFTIAHQNGEDVIDTYTLKASGFERYYIVEGETETENLIKINENQFCVKLYKNDSTTPLQCFNDGTSDKADISDYLTDLFATQHVYSYIQSNSNYVFIDSFPTNPDNNKTYVLTQDLSVAYPRGLYHYINKKWVQDMSSDYVFVGNLSQIESDTPYTFSDLNVPENCQGEDGAILLNEEGNVLLDTVNNLKEVNEFTMDEKWLVFYLTVDNSNDSLPKINCYVKGNNEGV